MPKSNYFIDAVLPDGVRFCVDKSIFNEVYLPYIFSDERIKIFFGGAGSGKSVSVFQSIVLNCLLFDRNCFVLTKEKRTSTTSSYNEVMSAIRTFKLEKYFEVKQQPRQISCRLNGRMIWFEGCEDVENIKSLKFPVGAVNTIVMEEATNFTKNDYDQLKFRQRGVDYDSRGNIIKPIMNIIFNPISKAHWLYKEFFQGRWNEATDRAIRYFDYIDIGDGEIAKVCVTILKTWYIHNKFLSKEDVATYLSTKDKNQYNVYVLGNFGSLGKTIFAPNENYFIEDGLKQRINSLDGIVRMGQDFGGGVADFAFVKCKINKKKKEIYVYDEFGAVDITIPELWTMIKRKVMNNGYLFCDVGNDMRKQLKNLGCPVKSARKGKNTILTGLNWLKEYKIIIDSDCRQIIGNFELYSWKKNRLGEYIEIPEDIHNDFIDALRYALSYDMILSDKSLVKSRKGVI